ncbi:MAG: polymer-forming cytoskeletal protein [Nitrospira sp.]|nr:polymer-forming cytoskeletal protein [Nitrospira sp.]
MWKQENTAYAEDGTALARQSLTGGRPVPADTVIAFIGKGVAFKGVITYSGTVRIDGTLDGEIYTDGGLIVGPEAVITAKVTAGIVVCEGTVKGDINAEERITLLDPAMIEGSLNAPVLSVEEGVRMNGTLEMAPVVQRVAPREVKLHAVGPSSRQSVKQAEE